MIQSLRRLLIVIVCVASALAVARWHLIVGPPTAVFLFLMVVGSARSPRWKFLHWFVVAIVYFAVIVIMWNESRRFGTIICWGPRSTIHAVNVCDGKLMIFHYYDCPRGAPFDFQVAKSNPLTGRSWPQWIRFRDVERHRCFDLEISHGMYAPPFVLQMASLRFRANIVPFWPIAGLLLLTWVISAVANCVIDSRLKSSARGKNAAAQTQPTPSDAVIANDA